MLIVEERDRGKFKYSIGRRKKNKVGGKNR
jgi:hypothetical protein